MKSRSKFDKQFKIDSVELLDRSGKTTSEISEDLGIRPNLLSRWRRELRDNNGKAFPGRGIPRDEELYKLKKELEPIPVGQLLSM
ncbi:MAG: transposase [Spirochaetota bacterium]|nr:transposase [Spirochaetota bacterium]